ncbi:hypothetical protein TYRP_008426 [Tyrophagus putrescentiae]|nr:hypothetical protein TYRP_008426 [Tyrophagus putrescentiae]
MGCTNSTEKEAIDGDEELNVAPDGEEEKEEEEEAKEAEEGKDGEADGEGKEGEGEPEDEGAPKEEEEGAKEDGDTVKEGEESPMFPGPAPPPALGKALKTKTKTMGGKLGKMKMKKGKDGPAKAGKAEEIKDGWKGQGQ